jgi:hypothetical protein
MENRISIIVLLLREEHILDTVEKLIGIKKDSFQTLRNFGPFAIIA